MTVPYTCRFLWRADYIEDFKWRLHFRFGVAFWRVGLRRGIIWRLKVTFEGHWRPQSWTLAAMHAHTIFQVSTSQLQGWLHSLQFGLAETRQATVLILINACWPWAERPPAGQKAFSLPKGKWLPTFTLLIRPFVGFLPSFWRCEYKSATDRLLPREIDSKLASSPNNFPISTHLACFLLPFPLTFPSRHYDRLLEQHKNLELLHDHVDREPVATWSEMPSYVPVQANSTNTARLHYQRAVIDATLLIYSFVWRI